MHRGSQTRAVQHRVQTCIAQPATDAFFDLLTGPRLLEGGDAPAPQSRNRLFPQRKVLSMFCTQVLSADRSCQRAVDGEAVRRLALDLPPCSSNTGGYCKARQRLPTDIPMTLARETGVLVSVSFSEVVCTSLLGSTGLVQGTSDTRCSEVACTILLFAQESPARSLPLLRSALHQNAGLSWGQKHL